MLGRNKRYYQLNISSKKYRCLFEFFVVTSVNVLFGLV